MDAAIHIPAVLSCRTQSDDRTALVPVVPPGEPKREAPAVCRWCKGTRKITVNFKTKRCEECANENGTIGPEGVGVGWKVKKTFCVDA
jgi:hypothetical protein